MPIVELQPRLLSSQAPASLSADQVVTAGLMHAPGLCAENASHQVYVATRTDDIGNPEIVLFDAPGARNSRFGGPGTGHVEFTTIDGLTFLGTRLYALDATQGRIQRLDIAGNWLSEFASTFRTLANDGTRLYGAVGTNHLGSCATNGTGLVTWDGARSGDDGSTRSVSVAASGSYVVSVHAPTLGSPIRLWTPGGTFLAEWGKPTYTELTAQGFMTDGVLTASAVAFQNNLVLALDAEGDNVQFYDVDGRYLRSIHGAVEFVDGQLNAGYLDAPFGLLPLASGEVLVTHRSDEDDQPIVVFDAAGRFARCWGGETLELLVPCDDHTVLVLYPGRDEVFTVQPHGVAGCSEGRLIMPAYTATFPVHVNSAVMLEPRYAQPQLRNRVRLTATNCGPPILGAVFSGREVR